MRLNAHLAIASRLFIGENENEVRAAGTPQLSCQPRTIHVRQQTEKCANITTGWTQSHHYFFLGFFCLGFAIGFTITIFASF